MRTHYLFTPLALAAALAATPRMGAAAGEALRADSTGALIRALTAPSPSPFAPTVCVVPEDQDPRAARKSRQQ
jgi:hypothetical protein